jgi:hypothetical protein
MDDYRDYAMTLVDDGAISERELLLACLKFMTQDEVCQVLEANEILVPEIDCW